MPGPSIQMPGVLTPILNYTLRPDGRLDRLDIKQEWGQYFHNLELVAFNGTRSGSTAARPTSTMPGRWVGMPYFDQQINREIFLQSVNPDVWFDPVSTSVASATSAVFSALGISKLFVSAQQTITAAGALTLAHGLPQPPRLITAILKNTTAEGGYNVGDEYPIPGIIGLNQATNRGISVVPDATNLNIRFGSEVNGPVIVNKTTGDAFTITQANWNIIFMALA